MLLFWVDYLLALAANRHPARRRQQGKDRFCHQSINHCSYGCFNFFRNTAAWAASAPGYSTYEGISPSRSPGGSAGPTYTQLGGSGTSGRAGQATGVAGYHQSAGLWGHWPTPVVPPADSSPNNGGPAGAGGPGGPAAGSAAGHGPQGSELVSDMLQMLDHSGTSGFEDLNMFSSNFEWPPSR